MPDDALPPDSLVGRMLNPEPDFTADEAEMAAAPWSYLEPLPLWRLMHHAYDDAPNRAGEVWAAEIEALRDWLLPEEPEPDYGHRYEQRHIIWQHNNKLRALLTEQARIARGQP